MIRVTIFRDSENNYIGFKLAGHAGYADRGQDIICAAASVLSLNTVNSIGKLTEDNYLGESDEEHGILKFKFTDKISPESRVLMKSFVLGMETIQKEYGTKYIKILFREV